ncbi:MAG TPA: YceI family protein [Candidatus Dormibacteraeota bacterium]|nr:YceI family protein [Candidatus Dormibacteraeota bacterium]
MPRRLLIPLVAAVGLVVLLGGGAYVYYFSGLRTAPPTLTLATPSASASPTTTPSTTPSGATTWTVATGSLAGYRVKEQFVGQSSTHEAVARTSAVSGQVTITQSSTTYELSAATITVQLSGLASVDSVAGYNVTNRDRIVQRSLEVSSFPTTTFVAGSVALPDGAASGQTVTVSVPGKLTIHGVTKDVTANLQLRVSGSTAQVAGTIATNMTDFGVSPPNIGFTTVQPAVTIEVSLNLMQSA